MDITPYLFLNGRCDAALSFYQSVLGAEILFVQRFKDAPVHEEGPMSSPDAVMHASFRIGSSNLMASDGDGTDRPLSGFCLSISVKDIAEGAHLFGKLAEGGSVVLPFGPSFWTEGFGMVTDRFGVPWMVSVAH